MSEKHFSKVSKKRAEWTGLPIHASSYTKGLRASPASSMMSNLPGSMMPIYPRSAYTCRTLTMWLPCASWLAGKHAMASPFLRTRRRACNSLDHQRIAIPVPLATRAACRKRRELSIPKRRGKAAHHKHGTGAFLGSLCQNRNKAAHKLSHVAFVSQWWTIRFPLSA